VTNRADAFDADLEAWEAWDPPTVAERLDGLDTPWCVVGGWALELFHGVTREHEDLEIAVPSADFEMVRERLAGYEFFVPVGEGRLRALEHAGDAFFVSHQTWVREPATGKWRLDVMRNPHDGDTWICRRDRTIRLPYAEVVAHTKDGVPYMQPEIALLFKGKLVREKDEADLETSLPFLNDARRSWLRNALARAYGDDHAWIARL
jgi:hypothetical protein